MNDRVCRRWGVVWIVDCGSLLSVQRWCGWDEKENRLVSASRQRGQRRPREETHIETVLERDADESISLADNVANCRACRWIACPKLFLT